MNDIEQFGRENLIKIAHWYYSEEMTQEQIAKKLNCTRQRINRIIKSLTDLGIVTIQIHGGTNGYLALEDALEKKYALQRVIIADVGSSADRGMMALSQKCARYLETFIGNKQVVGISWGSTLSQVVACLCTQVKSLCQVVQLTGGVYDASAVDTIRPDTTARLLARKLSCGCIPLCIPAKAAYRGLGSPARELFARCDIALLGVGDLAPGCTADKLGYFHDGELAAYAAEGCVGELAFNRFRPDGQCLGRAAPDRAVGVDLDTLQKIPYVVVVAGGGHKVSAVEGALRTGCVDVLLVDSMLARSLASRCGIEYAGE